MNKPTVVSEQTFDQEVLKADLPVLADFWADWCGPCRMLAPVLEDLAREYDGTLKFAKVDVDDNPNLAIRYNILSIPTLGLFKNGMLVARMVGYMPKAEVKRQVDAALGGTS